MYAHGMASTMSLHRSWPKKEELAAACTVDNLFRSRRMLGLAAEVVVQEAVQFRCGHRCGLVVVVLEQERRSKCRREFDRTKTRRRCIQSRMRACVREKESGGACVCVFAQLATIMDVRRMRIYRNRKNRLLQRISLHRPLSVGVHELLAERAIVACINLDKDPLGAGCSYERFPRMPFDSEERISDTRHHFHQAICFFRQRPPAG